MFLLNRPKIVSKGFLSMLLFLMKNLYTEVGLNIGSGKNKSWDNGHHLCKRSFMATFYLKNVFSNRSSLHKVSNSTLYHYVH